MAGQSCCCPAAVLCCSTPRNAWSPWPWLSPLTLLGLCVLARIWCRSCSSSIPFVYCAAWLDRQASH